jgi:hypothetical protein
LVTQFGVDVIFALQIPALAFRHRASPSCDQIEGPFALRLHAALDDGEVVLGHGDSRQKVLMLGMKARLIGFAFLHKALQVFF